MVCEFEGCENKLRTGNKTGYCKWHHNKAPSVKQRKQQWAEENVEARRRARTKWAKANPQKNRESLHNRRARLKNAYVETIDLEYVWFRDAGICWICNEPCDPNDWWLEHKVPLSRGGKHEYDNVAVSHAACNQRKSGRLMEEI